MRYSLLKQWVLPILILLFTVWNSEAANSDLPIGQFSRNQLDGWEQKNFKGETQYRLKKIEGISVLSAESKATGSGLFKERPIDLTQTPYLNWSWRVGGRLTGLNEQSKSGDDFAARIYVVVKGGLAFWQTKAINYVWASNTPKGIVWPNAFAGKNAMMWALQDAGAPLNQWQHEKRNVRQDFKALFGEDIQRIDAIAIMTDTDNSNRSASALYGDIWFSKE